VYADRDADYGHEPENIVFARLCIAQGRAVEAIPLLQRQLDAAEGSSRVVRAIEILCLQTLVLKKADNPDGAMAALARALALAETGDCRRLFLDEGPPMAALLRQAVASRIRPDFARRLLAAFPTTAGEDGAAAALPASPPGLIEPLSERELEVLALIAEGHSNREIGRRLFIALDTVKGHNRRIFGKLQVQRRTEAVARARLLGLL
jgi:LuxR family maltose regulon positive regulatory protein